MTSFKSISVSDRDKIIQHKQNGETEENIAKWLFISKSSVTRLWAQYQKTGSVLPKRVGRCGRKPKVSSEKMKDVLLKIEKQPDISLEELIECFDLEISVAALSKRLIKLGYTFKKRISIQKSKNGQT